jgi:hypothetical protein
MMKRLTLLLCALGAGLFATVPVAAAKAPPLGRYTCYQYSAYVGYLYSGFFKLQAGGKYQVNGKRSLSGKYTVGGSNVNFTTGPYHKYHWYGKVRKDNHGKVVIDVKDHTDPSIVLNCSH